MASIPRSKHMRLVSKAIPWMIDIVAPRGRTITCEIVWEAIYAALQEPIADSEWAFVVNDRWQRATVEKAALKRQDAGDPVTGLKRVDWLGESATFKGLERDEDFERHRLLPGHDPCSDTWVMKFGSGDGR
jgi:hypothetical protein